MRLSRRALFAYGIFGLPLALVALPIYVYAPQFYVERFGVSLTAVGSILFAARMFDAFIDPGIGLWIDRARARRGYGYFILLALPPLALGFAALFHPISAAGARPLTWLLTSLVLVYAGFSLATIAHQSWGAALSQMRDERSRITGVREACGLTGVLIAAALPSAAGISVLPLVFVAMLLVSSAFLLSYSPRPEAAAGHSTTTARIAGLDKFVAIFRNRPFRWLFAVFVVNGTATAIPATLFLFFAKDRLQVGDHAGLFLVLYFAAAALFLPLWVAVGRRHGEAFAWLASMLLAVAAFVWVFALPPDAAIGFGIVCVLSGIALGADLALPPALLAAVIGGAGDSGTGEGVYFGVWTWATKMNLALAAGVALPLLQQLGYVPGTVNADGMQALRIGYALLPCGLKLVAAWLLWRAPLKDL